MNNGKLLWEDSGGVLAIFACGAPVGDTIVCPVMKVGLHFRLRLTDPFDKERSMEICLDAEESLMMVAKVFTWYIESYAGLGGRSDAK